ncbi:MAG: NAD(P)H-dependent glycerol-3-phosphate dehydrogenase [Clostridia bacterium]
MKISILGLGAYGIALANVLYNNDNEVSMWTKYQEEADIVLLKRENRVLLPGVRIPKKILITTNLEECIKDAKIIVLAVPISAVREVSRELSKYLTNDQIICIVSKGIENKTNKLMSIVIYEETKCENICMISGPSFAIEFVQDTEIGLIVASNNEMVNMCVKVCLENDKIAVNSTSDLVGVEVAAAIKNVFAIFMGMIYGMKKNDSTKAAILTCLIKDIRLIIEVLGGKSQTIFSYAGIGDILLTCMSEKSRNFTFGKYIGQGLNLDDALEHMKLKTVEGINTLKALVKMLDDKQIDIKSVKLLYNILYRGEKTNNILRDIKN